MKTSLQKSHNIITNIPVFLTETIDNQTSSLDQKINENNDQIQGKKIILIYGRIFLAC